MRGRSLRERLFGGARGLDRNLLPFMGPAQVGAGHPEEPYRLPEDPRCPVCEEFESTGAAPTVRGATVRGEVRTEYTLASFLDDRLGGSGSEKAVNALRAALDEGKFAEYHDVLYANQPEETEDGFTDARLLELAGRVKGLRTPAFDSAVQTMKYHDFVTASEKAYQRAGGTADPRGPGTPTMDINDVRVPAKYSASCVRTSSKASSSRTQDGSGSACMRPSGSSSVRMPSSSRAQGIAPIGVSRTV